MDQHARVQQWRDYFLQNHHIVFIRNDPDGSFASEDSRPRGLSTEDSSASATSSTNDDDTRTTDLGEDPPHSSLYARKTAVELLLADQRQILHQTHRRELLKIEARWQTEVAGHLTRIEKLLDDVRRLEATASR